MSTFHGEGEDFTRECECGGLAIVTGSISGPSLICAGCTARMLAFIKGEPGAEFPPERRFPLVQPVPVSCGLRTDLPKAQRRHRRIYLGTDTRHVSGGFEDLHIYACATCGADKQTRTPPAP